MVGARNADVNVVFQRDLLGQVIAEVVDGRTLSVDGICSAGKSAARHPPVR
jgi:hypothetical protein